MIASQWESIWQSAYSNLQKEIPANQLKIWIDPLDWVRAEETKLSSDDSLSDSIDQLHFAVPNDFFAEWVRDHYLSKVEGCISQVTGRPCRIILENQMRSQAIHTDPLEVNLVAPPSRNATSGASEFSKGKEYRANIDPRYRFEDFIVGSSNQFAFASAFAISEKPGSQYNPLFINSPPGLGKTHLLHAIGNHIIEKNKTARVFYISAENFMNELIESIQNRQMSEFRNKYRDSFDCILVDDIQFIAGKGKTEEEFFHTFNSLYGSNRQIVITSDRAPKEIQGLEDRIRTRFEWGLVVDILPPEIETRIAILKAKAEKEDIYLPEDVAILTATHVKSNVRELEGTLIRLQAQASLTGAEITLEMARNELKTLIPDESSTYTVEAIQNAVVKHCGLRIQDLKSTKRTKAISLPRQVAMYLVRKYTGMGYKEISTYFGGKDHSTIIHAVKKVEASLENNDSEMQNLVEGIQNQL